jgi:uncharacterized protein involved in exopolysaccharide biosynthesis
VRIRFRAPTPELSFQVVNALLDAYQGRSIADHAAQAELAISFYEGRRLESEEQLAKSNAALRRYMAANPRLAASDNPRSPAAPAPVDPQLSELRNRVELDENEFERARTTLEQARLQASAAQQGRELGFQVLDPPELPVFRSRDTRRLLMFPAAGLVVGLSLSAALLLLLCLTDRSLRWEGDLPMSVALLGSLPHLYPRRRRGSPSDFARRMIGSLLTLNGAR